MSPFLRANVLQSGGLLEIFIEYFTSDFLLWTLKRLLHPGGYSALRYFYLSFRQIFVWNLFGFDGWLTKCSSKEFRFFQIIRFLQSFREFIARIGLLNSRIIKIFEKLACSLFLSSLAKHFSLPILRESLRKQRDSG